MHYPHLNFESIEQYFDKEITDQIWPKSNKDKLNNPTYELVIQINGKKKHAIELNTGSSQEEVEKICIEKFDINTKEAKKVIFLEDKLINIVI